VIIIFLAPHPKVWKSGHMPKIAIEIDERELRRLIKGRIEDFALCVSPGAALLTPEDTAEFFDRLWELASKLPEWQRPFGGSYPESFWRPLWEKFSQKERENCEKPRN
jgi:hypothetical protein